MISTTIDTSFVSIFLRRWISQSRRVALSKVSLNPPTNAFSSSVPKAIKFFNSGSRDLKVPPESEYVCCVFFSCRSTEPIIGGCLPSSLRRVMRCWYEIGVTLYGPKPNVGSSVKGRYSTGLQQNSFRSCSCLFVPTTQKGSAPFLTSRTNAVFGSLPWILLSFSNIYHGSEVLPAPDVFLG